MKYKVRVVETYLFDVDIRDDLVSSDDKTYSTYQLELVRDIVSSFQQGDDFYDDVDIMKEQQIRVDRDKGQTAWL